MTAEDRDQHTADGGYSEEAAMGSRGVARAPRRARPSTAAPRRGLGYTPCELYLDGELPGSDPYETAAGHRSLAEDSTADDLGDDLDAGG
jgi:hypothetical protein